MYRTILNTTVSHHEDSQEAVDDSGEVKDDSHPDWPTVLEEKRQHHSLHRAGILASTDSLSGVNVADMRVVGLPVALHTYTVSNKTCIIIKKIYCFCNDNVLYAYMLVCQFEFSQDASTTGNKAHTHMYKYTCKYVVCIHIRIGLSEDVSPPSPLA